MMSATPSGSTALEKVAETLQCPLCLDFYKDPVALTCQHNFCRGCIKQVVPRQAGAYHALTCPVCREKMQLRSRDGVDKIPKNFEREGIVEAFQTAEREHARSARSLKESVEDAVTENLVKQIDKIHMYSQAKEHENKQMRQSEQGDVSMGEPLSDEVFFSQTHSGFDADGTQIEETASRVHDVPLQQEDCFLTQQQQQQQQRVRQLLQEQSKLQLKLEQEVTDEFVQTLQQQPQEPDWRQQQTDRWNELHPPAVAEYQTDTSLPLKLVDQPQHYQYPQSPPYPLSPTTYNPYLHREKPPVTSQCSEPQEHDWRQQQTDGWNELHPPAVAEYQTSTSLPLKLVDQPQLHQYPQSLPCTLSGYGYPYPHKEKPPVTSQCSECHFPASAHCDDCLRFFCWQCIQDRHNTTRGLYAGHKVTELEASISQSECGDSCSPLSTQGSSVSAPKQDSPITLNTAMASLNVAAELGLIGADEQIYVHKIPYKCDINAMGPGKHITVYGQPAKNCKRFHVNFQRDRNTKTGDIALHFNPRFDKPLTVVCNSRMKGRYGSEERRAPSFPFMVGRPFKMEFICLLDKFEVRVDNQYFISYKHRIHDLASIKVFVIAGDVEISSVLGCP